MYTSSKGNNSRPQLGESDKDRKMRLVGHSNKRAERRLTKQLQDIDKHLQVNLRQITGDMERKSSSSSPTMPTSSKYPTSSTDSASERANQSSQSRQKHSHGTERSKQSGLGEKVLTSRKNKQSSNHGSTESDNRLQQLREKTFTIIDHATLSDEADGVTDNYHGPGGKWRDRALDDPNNHRLIQAASEKPRRNNIRNEMASIVSSKGKSVRGELVTSNRAQQNTRAMDKNSGQRHANDRLHRPPGQWQDKRRYITGRILPNTTGETLEYRGQAFSLNDSGNLRPKTNQTFNNNNSQLFAKDEQDRRQLRKMNILSNLNKKHMSRNPSTDEMEVFTKHKEDEPGVPHVLSPPVTYGFDIVQDTERPRPKSAIFSSHRRPRFTSDDDDVFLEDLDIIDIDDDGLSSDDDDVLNKSFVAPLKSSSRHQLGLPTRSTSDISPSTFRHEESHFRSSKDLHPDIEVNILTLDDDMRVSVESSASGSQALSNIEAKPNVCKTVKGETSVDRDKSLRTEPDTLSFSRHDTTEKLSSKSETNNSFKRRSKTETFDKNRISPNQEIIRQTPAYPRKLKPLFKPDTIQLPKELDKTTDEEKSNSECASPTSPKSDTQILTQKSSQKESNTEKKNSKLQRNRQRTWTAGLGARDFLKRPLPPTSFGPQHRVKSDLGNVMARAVTRRRARTSSELKKCSKKELEDLKSGNVASVAVEDTGKPSDSSDQDKDGKSIEISESLRSCRYLRSKTESDSLTSVNVETY